MSTACAVVNEALQSVLIEQFFVALRITADTTSASQLHSSYHLANLPSSTTKPMQIFQLFLLSKDNILMDKMGVQGKTHGIN